MAVVIIDGRVRVTWCTAISSIAAPTTTELNNGTLIQGYITPDGLDISASTGKVDVSNLGSTYTTTKAGRRGFDISIKFHHESGTDVPYNLFPYNTDGYIVVRRGTLATTAWASTDKVEVYPINTGEAQQEKPAVDGTWDFTSPMFVSTDPNTRAVVA
ncbi:MAG: hypothetical protein M3N43_13405 [Actinomycetota bacterium]|nr:hypothetical protein [Actinomycetota bacterium]